MKRGDIYSGARWPHSARNATGPDDRPSGGVTIEGSSSAVKPETTLPPMLTPQTKRDLSTAGKKVRDWTEKRDELVKQAVAEGGTLREVGEAVGLTHTAVSFIAHGRPR